MPQIADVRKRLKIQFVGHVQREGKQTSLRFFIIGLTNNIDLE